MGCGASQDDDEEINSNEPLELVAYDFDKTITCKHLYFALNLLGASDAFDQEEAVIKMQNEQLIDIFGGMERIERLDTHFNLLTRSNIQLVIISFGYEAVIKNALDRIDLLHYFNPKLIIGNDTELLSDVFNNKGLCLQKIIKAHVKEKFNKNRVLFVDDDQNNIKTVDKLNIANTLWISDQNGISEQQMKMIEARAPVQKNADDSDVNEKLKSGQNK